MKSDRCVLCGSVRSRVLYASYDRMFRLPGAFRVVRCLSCKALYLRPKLKSSQLSKYYPSKAYYAYKEGKKGFFGTIREFLISHRFFLLPSVPAMPDPTMKPGRILDVGCGTGDSLVSLQKLGWVGYGLDRDKKALMIAKKRGIHHVRYGTYKNISGYPDGFFDCVRLYHVIEHLDDPRLCLSLIQRKLVHGGKIIIGTPNGNSVASRIFGTYWYNLDSPRHLMIFSPNVLSPLLLQEGFADISISFASAGGIIGSVGYWLEERFTRRFPLIHIVPLVLLLYPLEKLLDIMRRGDVFVAEARKP